MPWHFFWYGFSNLLLLRLFYVKNKTKKLPGLLREAPARARPRATTPNPVSKAKSAFVHNLFSYTRATMFLNKAAELFILKDDMKFIDSSSISSQDSTAI